MNVQGKAAREPERYRHYMFWQFVILEYNSLCHYKNQEQKMSTINISFAREETP